MLKRIKSYLFPELDELKEQVETLSSLVGELVNRLQSMETEIEKLHAAIQAVKLDGETNTKSIGILIDKVEALPEADRIELWVKLTENLQTRVTGLEGQYQNHRELKQIPTVHGTFRALRQSLERDAHAKSRNST